MKIAVFIPSAKANGFSTDYSSYNRTPFNCCFTSEQYYSLTAASASSLVV